MSGASRGSVRLFDVVDGEEAVNHGTVARLATVAILRSRLVISELRETVLPELPHGRRAMIGRLVRRLEHEDLFDEGLLEEVEALGDYLHGRVEAGTQVFWEPVECHVRGGYHVVHRDSMTADLARARDEIQQLHETLLATLAAARALRKADELLGT